jgi:hypothetical protein
LGYEPNELPLLHPAVYFCLPLLVPGDAKI